MCADLIVYKVLMAGAVKGKGSLRWKVATLHAIQKYADAATMTQRNAANDIFYWLALLLVFRKNIYTNKINKIHENRSENGQMFYWLNAGFAFGLILDIFLNHHESRKAMNYRVTLGSGYSWE